jgi:acyl carrier protein
MFDGQIVFPYFVFGLVCVAIVILVVLEDAPNRRHRKELKSRKPLSVRELHDQYLPDVPLAVITTLVRIVVDQFGEDPRLIRPQDNHCLINDDLDSSGFVSAIENAFAFKFTDTELKNLDGSFGSIARHCAKCCKMV